MSTMTCEHAFSVHNLIRTKSRIRLGSKNLEAMLRIALEGPNEGVETLLVTLSHFGRTTIDNILCIMLIPLLI